MDSRVRRWAVSQFADVCGLKCRGVNQSIGEDSCRGCWSVAAAAASSVCCSRRRRLQMLVGYITRRPNNRSTDRRIHTNHRSAGTHMQCAIRCYWEGRAAARAMLPLARRAVARHYSAKSRKTRPNESFVGPCTPACPPASKISIDSLSTQYAPETDRWRGKKIENRVDRPECKTAIESPRIIDSLFFPRALPQIDRSHAPFPIQLPAITPY